MSWLHRVMCWMFGHYWLGSTVKFAEDDTWRDWCIYCETTRPERPTKRRKYAR